MALGGIQNGTPTVATPASNRVSENQGNINGRGVRHTEGTSLAQNIRNAISRFTNKASNVPTPLQGRTVSYSRGRPGEEERMSNRAEAMGNMPRRQENGSLVSTPRPSFRVYPRNSMTTRDGATGNMPDLAARKPDIYVLGGEFLNNGSEGINRNIRENIYVNASEDIEDIYVNAGEDIEDIYVDAGEDIEDIYVDAGEDIEDIYVNADEDIEDIYVNVQEPIYDDVVTPSVYDDVVAPSSHDYVNGQIIHEQAGASNHDYVNYETIHEHAGAGTNNGDVSSGTDYEDVSSATDYEDSW